MNAVTKRGAISRKWKKAFARVSALSKALLTSRDLLDNTQQDTKSQQLLRDLNHILHKEPCLRSEVDVAYLAGYAQRFRFFEQFDIQVTQRICRFIWLRQAPSGSVLVKEGDNEDDIGFCVIISGRCIVTKESNKTDLKQIDGSDSDTTNEQKVERLATLQPGDSFGEEALINSSTRNATVTAETACRLFQITRSDFNKAMQTSMKSAVYRPGKARDILQSGSRTPEELAELVKFARSRRFFQQFDSSICEDLCKVLSYKELEAGELAFLENNSADAFYIILSGSMKVMRKDGMRSFLSSNPRNGIPASDYGSLLCILTEGDSFGEAALITDTKRNATLFAQDPTELMVLHKTDFMDVLADKTKAIAYNTGRIMKILDIPCDLRSEADVETLMGLGKTVAFFKQFADELLRDLCRVMTVLKPQYGECVCHQGDPADSLYILLEGAASVHAKNEADPALQPEFSVNHTLGPCISNLLKGDCFGEKGLHDPDSLRSASVVCQSDHARLIALSKADYLQHLAAPNRLVFAPGLSSQALMKAPSDRTEVDLQYMREWCSTLAFFKALPPSYVRNICNVMQYVSVKQGSIVVKEGDQADLFFIIVQGKVHVLSNQPPHSGVIATLGVGETFGELALHVDGTGCRQNTLIAAEDAVLAAITKTEFCEFISAQNTVIAPGRARRILASPPADRTEEDLNLLLRCFTYSQFFNQFTVAIQKHLCRYMAYETRKVGDVVFKQADAVQSGADLFYYILSGAVVVWVRNNFETLQVEDAGTKVRRNQKLVATLHQGDTFGEAGLMRARQNGSKPETQAQRSATVTVCELAELVVLPRDAFRIFQNKLPREINFQPERQMQLAQTVDEGAGRETRKMALLEAIIATIPLFQKTSRASVQEICRHMEYEVHDTGHVFYRAGDCVDNCYIIAQGRVVQGLFNDMNGKMEGNQDDFASDRQKQRGLAAWIVTNNQCLGEGELLGGAKYRFLTARAATEVRVLSLNRNAYRSLWPHNEALRRSAHSAHDEVSPSVAETEDKDPGSSPSDLLRLLLLLQKQKQLGAFQGATNKDLFMLSLLMRRLDYPAKAKIAICGTPGDSLFMVAKGQCKITSAPSSQSNRWRSGHPNNNQRPSRTVADLAIIGPGQFFGERQISASNKSQSCWSEDIATVASTVFWTIGRGDMETYLPHLLPNLRSIAKMKAKSYSERIAALLLSRTGLGVCGPLVPAKRTTDLSTQGQRHHLHKRIVTRQQDRRSRKGGITHLRPAAPPSKTSHVSHLHHHRRLAGSFEPAEKEIAPPLTPSPAWQNAGQNYAAKSGSKVAGGRKPRDDLAYLQRKYSSWIARGGKIDSTQKSFKGRAQPRRFVTAWT